MRKNEKANRTTRLSIDNLNPKHEQNPSGEYGVAYCFECANGRNPFRLTDAAMDVNDGKYGQLRLKVEPSVRDFDGETSNIARWTFKLESFEDQQTAQEAKRYFLATFLWLSVTRRRHQLGISESILPVNRTTEGFSYGTVLEFDAATGGTTYTGKIDYSYIYEIGTTPPILPSVSMLPSGVTSGQELVRMLRDALYLTREGVPQVLINAMEIYSSSLLLQDAPSRFLLLMSAFESLSVQRDWRKDDEHGDRVQEMLRQLRHLVRETDDLPEHIRNSVVNNIRGNAWRESVSQSIRNMIDRYLPEPKSSKKRFAQAYKIRSKMVHEGEILEDIYEHVSGLEHLFRRLLACRVQLPLREGGEVKVELNGYKKSVTLEDWFPPNNRISE